MSESRRIMKWNPEDYARNSSAQLGWAKELIANCHFAGDEAVLDIGCGDGKITAEFARSLPNGRVVGIDSSAEFIRYAERHYPPDDFPNLRFVHMDARRIDFDEPFDLIFSNAAIHWVDDHPAVLRGCAKVLRPGGRLVISCGGGDNAAEVVAAFSRIVERGEWHAFFEDFEFPYHFHTPEDYTDCLPAAGFEPTRCELVEKDMTHDGIDAFAGWLRTTWIPWTQRVPEARREDFIREVVEEYLSRHPLDEEGRSHVRMVRLEVDAIKET